MKRRVLSLVVALALCLNLSPAWAFAAGAEAGGGLCPHHPAHTDGCGYASPVLGQECAHSHGDGCYTAETVCIHEHTAECYPDPEADPEGADPALCTHQCTEDSGCITRTLSCPHEHDDACGYIPEDPGAPCAFVCPICPIEDLIGGLPSSVSERNREQVQDQLSEIYALYDGLTEDQQQQVDLSPCAALLDQLAGSAAQSDGAGSPEEYEMMEDESPPNPLVVEGPLNLRTNGHTLTLSKSSAIQVTGTGELYIVDGGTISSKNGAGIEIQAGGFLSIVDPGTTVTGTTYALDIASGARVQLSAGTYTGTKAAIHVADGVFSALLERGYILVAANGEELAKATTITVSPCTDHSSKTYKPNAGAPTHTWTCTACKMEGAEKCTFTFDETETGTCVCGHTLKVEVDESDLTDLVYDGTIKPEDIKITVTLAETDSTSTELVKGTDYQVEYDPRTDAGEIKVTVAGLTFNGTFVKTYTVKQDEPGIKWDEETKELDYDGRRTSIEGELPHITITIKASEDLHPYLQYSYRKAGTDEFTDGLPLNAGEYEIKAYLEESQNYTAAETDPLLRLTIKKIDPVTTAPVATNPTYNRAEQALVTAGEVDARATGAKILFAASETGEYSTEIPTGTDAGDYEVWYKVEGTDNYNAVGPTKIEIVTIQRKPVTPVVTLPQYSYLYTGGWIEPEVTVKDKDYPLESTEYQVAYVNNRNVSTEGNPAKAVVTDKDGGNYAIEEVEVEFRITLQTQASLSITKKPDTVTYGDRFTLETTGGSGNGLVAWEITDGTTVAKVTAGGQITIIGDGPFTVKATKSGEDPATGVVNYEDATASWTFTADRKPVTATVTANNKFYDGNDTAIVHAVVEQGVLAGDEITIENLTGTFDTPDAGANKTVTVDITNAQITGNNSQHYDVTYSSTTVTATIHKAVAEITTPPVPTALTYNGSAQALIATGAVVDPTGVPVEYALSQDGPYSTDFPEGTNAGDYTVWYRIQETNNYTGEAPASIPVTIAKKLVAPTITLSQDSYVYDGNPKEPVVTLTEADGTIPAGEYTVEYSGNVNVGTATVTVTAVADGNYEFTPVTETFTITKEPARVVTAPKRAGNPLVFNNMPQELVTAGEAFGGTMVYSVDDENGTYEAAIPEKTDAGEYTVYYKVKGDANHSDSEVGSVTVTIAPKTVSSPTIELFNADDTPLVSYTYDGTAKKPKVVVKDGSTVIGAGEYNIVYRNNTDAGDAIVSITDKPNGNYTVTGSATFVIEKADIVFNPDPKAAEITYDGKAHELLLPGTTSGGEVLYALNSATSTYTAAIPPGTEAGDYTVYYKVVGDKNHNDLAVQSVPVTIQRKPLTTITIELSPNSFTYDGMEKLPTITVKDGKTVLPEEEYTWACDNASPTNEGTYTITISDAAGGNYDLSGVTANTAKFTIGKAAQAELVIGDIPDTTVYGGTFTLSASGGSSASAVTWSATGPATVDAATGEVKITGVGQVTITATNPGDQNYLPVSGQCTFTAAPKPVTADITVANRDYDGTTAATVNSVTIATINSDTVVIDPASITAAFDTPSAGAGKTVTLDTSKVQVTGANADKYAISYPETVTADITQATTQITTAPAKIDPLTYSGQPQALVTAGVTNVGFLVYSLDGTSFSEEIPTGTDAGTYTVYYKVDGTADYTGVAVNTTPISVTIAPKPITATVELSPSSFPYDGARKEPVITVKDGKTVIDKEQYTVVRTDADGKEVTELKNAGTYTVTVSEIPGKNYTFTAVTAQVEITAAVQNALKITGQPEHVYYGDTVTTLKAEGGSGEGTVEWSVTTDGASSTIDTATGRLTVKDVGEITVKAVRTVPNYGDVSDTWTFTVEPKPVAAAVTVAGKVYDGTTDVADTAITAEVKNSDLVDPDNDSITIAGLTGTYTDANTGTGKTVILDSSAATVTGDTAKYTVVYPASAKADITAKSVTVTVTLSDNDLQTDDVDGSYYYVYDGSEKNPTVTVTADDSAVLADSDYSVSVTGSNKNVGTATVTVTAKAGGNYTFTDGTASFAIRKSAAVLTQTPQAIHPAYNGTMQDLVSVGTATGGTVVYALKKGDTEPADSDYSAAIPQGENAGTYTVYYKVEGDANHDDTAPGQMPATIKPREFTPTITLSGDDLITAADGTYSYVYDGTAKTPAVTVMDGADEVDAGEYTVNYSGNVNAGTATVTVSDKNGGNYIVNGTITFEITRKAPAFTPPAAITGLQYSGEPQELVMAGVCNEGTVYYSVNGGSYSTTVPTATRVGKYTIDYKIVGDDNHSDTAPVRLGEVEIAKNTVENPTISLSSDTFTYDGEQHRPTITVYDKNSRVIPESEYTVTITGTKGNNMVDADTYTVTVTTPDTSNYVIQGVNTRTFTIKPAGQESISITGAQAQVRYGDTLQLGTTGGAGSGTITWTVAAKDGSTISSTISSTGLLTVRDVNTPIKVTVTRSAGDNYKEVSASWEFTAGKKPVTAEVTVPSKPFDGSTDVVGAVTATMKTGDLAFSGDSITISGLTATYEDENVGTDKKVNVNSSTATVAGTNADKYDITIPSTTTASILPVAARVDNAPAAVSPLTYDASQAQALVTAGTVTGGRMVYSLDDTNYTPAIPKAKDAGTYTVYYKAQGDGNHTDSEVGTVLVTIDKQTVTPQIELSPPGAQYDGNVKRPQTVTVRDADNNVIPTTEYTVVYDPGTNWKDVGDHKVTVKNVAGGNYIITPTDATFKISITAQNPLEIVNKPGLVHYGDTFTLSATGGSGNEKVTWSSSAPTIADIDANGFVTIKGTGSATITATKAGGGNYEPATATYPLNALKKPITAIVAADDRVYATGDTTATIHITWPDGALVGTDSINTMGITGAFADDSVGTNKTVTLNGTYTNDATAQKYDITIPPTATASITKADMAVPGVTGVSNLEYTGKPQPLVTGGDGNTLYSTARDGAYNNTVPTGTNAGTYTVWYKAKGDANHNDSEPQPVQVAISPKTLTADATNTTLSGGDLRTDTSVTPNVYYYNYDGTDKTPAVTITDGAAALPAGEYTVRYSGNRNVGTATVTITDNPDGNYIVSGGVSFEIRKGGAALNRSPEAIRGLTYQKGTEQELVTVGSATGGHIEYSLDGGTTYSSDIPKAENAGTYTVTYKVVGDDNHEDAPAVGSVIVTISPKTVDSPGITVIGTYTYDGSPKEPAGTAVAVKDGAEAIPAAEYTLSYQNNTDAGTATVIVTNASGGNYTVNGEASFTIGKADIDTSTITPPTGKTGLQYNGQPQELAAAGSVSGGTMVYSLTKTGEYFPAIPTQTAVDNYEVWYKVQGDGNHKDSAPASVDASIIVNNVTNPTIQVTPPSATYNGKRQEPTVTVQDDSGLVINGSEYRAAYATADGNTDLTKVGVYTLTITGVTGGNYTFDAAGGKNTATFEITPAGQTPLTITGIPDKVYYGDTIPLGVTGGVSGGTVTWTVDGGSAVASVTGSLLKITGVGQVTVTATSTADGYADQTASRTLYAEKKPVTAVVTAAAKDYDGTTAATVTATLQASDLVGSDVINIALPDSAFEDANAGADKKVNVKSTNADFTGSTGQENYAITYPATTTAMIRKADIKETDVTAPAAVENLTYTDDPQALVTAGTVTGGSMEYSTDGITYLASLPVGTDAKDYEIWYRVKGDSNHKDTDGVKLADEVTIAQQTVTDPIIEFIPDGASYNGSAQKPAVTVKDANGRVIPEGQYTVIYDPAADWTKVGDHKVTVTGKTDGNYNITPKDAVFTISPAGQSPLSIVDKPGTVRYGEPFVLSATGGSGAGAIKWVSNKPDIATIDQNGRVTVLKSGGPVTITATKLADGSHSEVSVTWSFSAEKRAVTPIVAAQNKEYDTTDTATLTVTWKDGDLLPGDSITLPALTGKFDTADVGTNKTVTITGTAPTSEKYAVTLPTSTTASITPKAATVTGVKVPTLTYDGSPKDLLTGGTATGGTLVYSWDGVSGYTRNVPQKTDAGTYTVWYKALAGRNYEDSPAEKATVTISPKPVSSPVIELSGDGLKQDAGGYYYEYDGTPKRPEVVVKDGSTVIPASEYTVGYSGNTSVGTATVTITDNPNGNYTVNGSKTFAIKAGAPALVTAPEPRDLTYSGSAQALVSAGTAVNGRIVYCLEQDGTYTTSIPRKTDAGNYEVWYKVQGSNGAADTEPDSVPVTIKPQQVTPIILLNNQFSYSATYTGSAQTPSVTVLVNGQPLQGGYYPIYSKNTDVGTAEVIVQSAGGNYQFFVVATFEITKGKAEFLAEPVPAENLVYTGEEQELVLPGVGKNGGIVLYSLDDSTYSASIPTGLKKGNYVVFAKVRGSDMYEESDVVAIRVKIDTNVVQSPKVALSQPSFNYTGSPLMPNVTVRDDENKVISPSEYTVTYSNNINVGEATVTVTNNGTNYSFAAATANFQIVGADQPVLDITGKQDIVRYGDTLRLGTAGLGGGVVTWSSSDTTVADIGQTTGVVTIKKAGDVTITADKAADGSYGAATGTWSFHVDPKPVTATVMAADKTYDGTAAVADGSLTVTISGLIPGDNVTGVTASGQFMDEKVGANKTVIVTGLTIPEGIREKYDITSYSPTATASITPKAAAVLDTDKPTAAGSLTYNGGPQLLLTSPGTAEGGSLMYSLDGNSYSYNIPTATDVGSYTVWYKVAAGDENHKDSTPVKAGTVTISANTDTPTVLCTPGTFQYDGTEKTPDVVVRDSAQRVIPEDEYTVALPSNRIAVGTYKVIVTDKPGGNYQFSTPVTGTFEIVAASQSPLSIITDKPTNVYYGDTFRLSAMGGSGSGAIQWSIAESSVATINDSGEVTVKGTGGFTVTAYREGADGYSDSNTDSVPFVATPKPVTPTVTAADKPYDGTKTAALAASWKPGDLVGTDTLPLTVSGEFETAEAGASKRVAITSASPNGVHGNYVITWPDSATASIYKVDAKLAEAPKGTALTYNGAEQALVTGGTTVDSIGTIVYSTSQNGTYSTAIPTGTNAGKHTVWYKVDESVNYTGIPAASIEVEIAKATPSISTNPTASGTAGQTLSQIALNGGAVNVAGKFAWKDGSSQPVNGTSYDVIFTPDDTANYNTVTIQVSVTVTADTGADDNGSDDTGSTADPAPLRATVDENGTATTDLKTADVSKMVQAAAKAQSETIVINPEVTGDVSKAKVSIPASSVSQIKDETNAALTVASPIADVTIPRAAMDTLSEAGGKVDVVTERVDQSVVLTLTAGGKPVEDLPGGVTLTVPVENAGPGTVAVLVHEDGTRETLQKSVVEDGRVSIPVSGSAKVEIVDNSKEFADVPATDWAADAVAFASARELFSGTSETTFSPDETMSRGMLATVLYRLEGQPDQDLLMQDLEGGYDDVSSDAWYAEGVAWAAEKGIVNGYGSGQFGPEDSVTREQFVVMLWRYAGSPQADGRALDFTDAGQANSYAQEALCWAVENGVLSGNGNGQLLPGGTATRAEAAQMLKNFIENT